MRAGELRHRVSIWQPVPGQRNAYGERLPGPPQLVARVWASLRSLSAKRMEIARAYASSVTHEIHLRWRSGLSTQQYLTVGDRRFTINGIMDPDGRKRELIMFATEVTS